MNLVEEFKKPANYKSFGLGAATMFSGMTAWAVAKGAGAGNLEQLLVAAAVVLVAQHFGYKALGDDYRMGWKYAGLGAGTAAFILASSLLTGSPEEMPADKTIEQAPDKVSMIEHKIAPAVFTPVG